MALTPVEIRHLKPPHTTFRGYRTTATDHLLEEIASSFEDVWRERADLADKVEQLEADLVRYRELESLLRTTLVSAEQASGEMRDQARREAAVILSEAHGEARQIQRHAFSENERLAHESRRLRAQLQDALSALVDDETAAVEDGEPPSPAGDAEEERSWYGYPSEPTEQTADAA
ncbi:MAG TPA: DivIVA domain-containing protein [Gaiellaceae bacterium]|jgi:cell division initiation protein|nr:DivIVA domain-containing protein [Gaiellaceae bacterium]